MHMKETIDQLKSFARAIEERPDIRVRERFIGEPATEQELALMDGLPEEVVELLRHMNGFRLEWEFVEPQGGGLIELPHCDVRQPIRWWPGGPVGFSDEFETLMLDANDDSPTVFVRKRGEESMRIVNVRNGRADEAVTVAASIQEYLTKGMGMGFGHYWQMCFDPPSYLDMSEQQMAIKRFQEVPKAPATIGVGSRIHFTYHAEGARGTVVRLHEAGPSSSSRFNGTTIAQVQCDEGTLAWIPVRFMHAAPDDQYECLREELPDLLAEADLKSVSGMLYGSIGRIMGELMVNFGSFYSNGRTAAGILSAYPLPDAADMVCGLAERLKTAGAWAGGQLSLTTQGSEFGNGVEPGTKWSYSIPLLLRAMFDGLWIRAQHCSADQGVPGNALLSQEMVARIEALTASGPIVQALRSPNPLVKPEFRDGGVTNVDTARALGIPETDVLFADRG